MKKPITTIDFFCYNFQGYLSVKNQDTLFHQILNKLSPYNSKLTIHSFISLNEDFLKHTKTTQYKNAKIKNYIDHNNVIINFINRLHKLAQQNYKTINKWSIWSIFPHSFNTINEILSYTVFSKTYLINKLDYLANADEEIPEEYTKNHYEKLNREINNINNNFFQLFEQFQEDIIQHIKQIDECSFYDTNFKEKTIAHLNESFSTFLKNLKEIVEEGNEYTIKAIVQFLISIIDITDIKSTFKKYSLPFIALDAFEYFEKINKFNKSNNTQAYMLEIYKLLTQNIAPLINLCINDFLSNVIIINNKIIIDFSGFDLMNSCDTQSQSTIKTDLHQGIGLAYELPNDINNLHANLISQNTFQLGPYTAFQYSNKSNEDLYNNIKLNCNNSKYLIYVEYPTFSSALFCQILQNNNNKEDKENINGLNYLIISNAPSYESAGLEHAITTNILNYDIIDDTKTNLIRQKQDIIIDYSNYKIDRKDNKVCAVRLSPFVCIKQYEYEQLSRAICDKRYNHSIGNDDNEINVDFKSPKNTDNVNPIEALNYIDSFFKDESYKYIQEKNNEFLKLFKQHIKKYLEDIHKINNRNKTKIDKKEYHKNNMILEAKSHKSTSHSIYSVMELMAISFSMKILQSYATRQTILKNKEVYLQQKLDIGFFHVWEFTAEISEFQSIKIDNEIYNLISSNAFVQVYDEQNNIIEKQVFLSRKLLQNKTKQDQYIFLEDFINENNNFQQTAQSFTNLQETIAANIQNDTYKHIFDQLEPKLYKDFKKNLQNLEDEEKKLIIKQAYEKIFSETISHIFPFMGYMEYNFKDLIKKISEYFFTATPFKQIIKKELGLAYFIMLKAKYADLSIYHKHYEDIFDAALLDDINHNLQKTKTNSERIVKSYFNAIISQKNIKNNISEISSNAFIGCIQEYINNNWQTKYEKLKKEIDDILFWRFTYKHNEPYAVKNKNYVTYPLIIQSNFMCFDFYRFLFGGKLKTGGIKAHPGFFHSFSTSNISDTIFVDRIVSFLVLDHIRYGMSLDDYIKELEDIDSNSIPELKLPNIVIDSKELNNHPVQINTDISKCQLMPSNTNDENPKKATLYEMFKNREKTINKSGYLAIDAYNEALDILEKIKARKFCSNEQNETDATQTKRLLECLEIIGQNNIKAMYVGIKEDKTTNNTNTNQNTHINNDKNTLSDNTNDKINTPPYFIGRLATTIIRKNGLWIG